MISFLNRKLNWYSHKIRNINGFCYLFECFSTYENEKDKVINKDNVTQELLEFLKDMIVNYTVLLATQADIFPSVVPCPEGVEGYHLTAIRLLDLFESRGFAPNFISLIND